MFIGHVCVHVCLVWFFRAFETKSNGLLLLPLQDIHLSLTLWPEGLRWYICICSFVCMLLVSGWDDGQSYLHCGSAPFFRVYGYMLSRVCECVRKRGTAAACPCAGLMMKIIQLILMQMNEASLCFSPLALSPVLQSTQCRLSREARQCWTVFFHGIVFCWEDRSTTTPGPLECQELKRSPCHHWFFLTR